MQDMKKKGCDSSSSDKDDLKQKERHIVSWSEEDDDILREQIGIHGTNNWAIIASKFENKSTRQCRRRWFTYLNSDFKKGGWSPEEDMLLCQAQKIFGNRWTEIAKVVSGRTDNAVKNRFSVLCKKRAKHDTSTKENNGADMNANKKRTRQNTDTILETSVQHVNIRRKNIVATMEDCSLEGDIRTKEQQVRPPFVVLLKNCHNTKTSTAQDDVNSMEARINESSGNKVEGKLLKKDDPNIVALMQQAELLNSLALKVNTEKTDQSFKNVWKVVQDFLKHSKESDVLGSHISNIKIQLEKFKDLLEDITSCHEGNQQFWRQELCQGSPESSEFSTDSTISSKRIDKTKMGQDDLCDGGICPLPNSEFNSPLQVTPLFRSMAEGIPSPHFSESERNFLLKTLGMESTVPNPTSTSPPCKRALLHCL